MMEKVVEYLKDKEKEMVSVLEELVNLESPSLNKEMVDKFGENLQRIISKYINCSIEFIENTSRGNHLRVEYGEGDSQILILCHMDTVWPLNTIQTMPFRIEEKRAYGPGTFDMKGGIVQAIFALHALEKLNIKLDKKIVLLFTSDEEVGGETSEELIKQEAQKSDYALILESASSKEGKWKTSRKGVAVFDIEVIGKAAHAGIEPEKGISAVNELAKHILYLHELSDIDNGTTVNVGVIEGGTTSNVIPQKAKATIDVRVTKSSEFERVIPLIEDLKPIQSGIKLNITGGINRPPMEKTRVTEDIYLLGKQIALRYLDFELEEELSGGASDGNFAAQYTATIDGLGPVGDGAHAAHEHIIMEELPKRSTLLGLLIMCLANEKDVA